MKKFNWLLVMLLLASVPALQSCDDDGYSIGGIGRDWAIVRATGDGGHYLEGSRWGMIDPVASSIPWYKPVDGEQVVAFLNLLADTDKGAQVKTEGIQEVLIKEVEDMTAENKEEPGNDPTVIYQGNMWLGGKLLNIISHRYLSRSEKYRISLVQDKIEPEAPETLEALSVGEDGYIHLELRYNTCDDVTGCQGRGRVPHNLEESYSTAKDVAEAEFKGFKVITNSKENGEGRVIVLDLDHPIGVSERAKDVHSTFFVK